MRLGHEGWNGRFDLCIVRIGLFSIRYTGGRSERIGRG